MWKVDNTFSQIRFLFEEMAFCDFSAPCCDWPFEVSLILNLFQSVLLKSNPSMLVDKEWINVEYRFKNAWKKVQLELASFLVHLGGKSVPINMAFRDFSAPCCDWPFEVSLILNLFQSVLLKSNPSMLVDKEWINVEYRFKIVWRRFHLKLASTYLFLSFHSSKSARFVYLIWE